MTSCVCFLFDRNVINANDAALNLLHVQPEYKSNTAEGGSKTSDIVTLMIFLKLSSETID